MGLKRIDSEWREVQVINGYAVLMAYSMFVFRGVGFLVFTWSTVVLLGGFVSMLDKFDFWSLTLISFIEILWINTSQVRDRLSYLDGLFSSFGTVNSLLKRSWKLADNDPKTPRVKQFVVGVRLVIGWVLAPVHMVVSYMCIIALGCLMVFGMVITTWISIIGLKSHYYCKDADKDRANLDPACNVLYILCVIQGALFLHSIVLGFSKSRIVKQVSRAYGFPDDRAVSGYLHAVRAGCSKKPSSARDRNLITYAIELMESKEPDRCLSGTLILERLLVREPSSKTKAADSDLTKGQVVVVEQRSEDNTGAHSNKEVEKQQRQPEMVIIEQQRSLIKKLIGSAAYTHILQKLLETLDSKSSHDREMRVAAARIVEHVATGGGIRLEQFPQGIQCISSLISTFQESEAESSDDQAKNNTNPLQRYRDLVLTGLRILWSLAGSEDNFIVISNTRHLVYKIMAPVSHDLVHRTHHSEWSTNLVEGSLKVMLRFVTAEGETAVELRRQISNNNRAVAALDTIITCEKCKGGELQMNAMQILTQLCMVKTACKGNLAKLLVEIFTNNGDSSIRSTAGKTLVGLLLGSSCVTTTLSEANYDGSKFVGGLVKILLQVGDNYTCRESAAEILEHLCIHYYENDEHPSTLKEAMTDVMPKVLREILLGCGSTGEKGKPGYVRPETDVESGKKKKKEHEEEKMMKKNASSPCQYKLHKLHVTLLSLCVTAFEKLGLDINAISPGDEDKGEGVAFRFAMKMVQLNSQRITVNCLAMMKLTTRMVIAAMVKHKGVVNPANLEGLLGLLAGVSETMLDLESSMVFTTSTAAAKTLVAPVEEQRSMVTATTAVMPAAAKTLDAVAETAATSATDKTLDALVKEAQKLHRELKEPVSGNTNKLDSLPS